MTIADKILSPENPSLIACVLTDRDVRSLDKALLAPADILELRIDMFERLDPDHVLATFSKAKEVFGKPLIATARLPEEGGRKEIGDRLTLYKDILPLCALLDAELRDDSLLQELKGLCAGHPTLLIGSYHNFETMPGDDVLDALVAKGDALGVDLVKIAVTAHERNEVTRFLMFTLRHKDRGIATMAMGEAGLPTRIMGPLFGSRITYGYVTAPSAPGQLHVVELDRLLRLLGLR